MNTRIEELKIRLIKLDTKITFYKTEIVKGHDIEENEMLLKTAEMEKAYIEQELRKEFITNQIIEIPFVKGNYNGVDSFINFEHIGIKFKMSYDAIIELFATVCDSLGIDIDKKLEEVQESMDAYFDISLKED